MRSPRYFMHPPYFMEPPLICAFHGTTAEITIPRYLVSCFIICITSYTLLIV